ncbi:MAG: hypothetical protein JW910_21150, partial [Anaerolineae bacterium]|nr:hypothetical protein [Anaerolineae bacterium]
MVRWVFGLAVRASALLVVLLSLVITATSLLHADVMARAWAGVEANADWEPFIAQTPGGVTVALVPAGCFMMGSTDEALEAAFEQCEAGTNGSGYCQRDRYADEQPVHEVCFDQPFWIGHYEVTNA